MSTQDISVPKKRGRPVTGQGTQIQVRLQSDLLDPIDAFAGETIHPDAPIGRPEAIRRILRDWLIGHGYLPSKSDEK